MPERPILIVHPNDETTKFLDKIKNYLIEMLGEQVHHFNIYPNEKSHQACLERISIHPENGLIIFLGHGRTDALHGGKGELYNNAEFVSREAKDENPDAYYYNDNFINESNSVVFRNKKVFCLSCNSNDKIAKFSVDHGAKSFLGFGDIPTSMSEFEDKEEKVTNDLVVKMKTELNYIIKTSLSMSIQRGLTFEGLLNHIQFITNQRMTDILVNQKSFKERNKLADYLFYLKREATIIGEKRLKLLE
jgi:hypothetical protein